MIIQLDIRDLPDRLEYPYAPPDLGILTVTERDIISDGYTQDEYRPINR